MTPEEKELEIIKSKMNEKQRTFTPITIKDLYNIEFPPNAWVVEKLVPIDGITIISGAPETYKSWIALLMAIAVAKGEKFLNRFEATKRNVLIIDEENPEREIQRRLKLLHCPEETPIFLLSQKGFIVRNEDAQRKVLQACEENEIEVVFIDSLIRVNDAEENDATAMASFFREIKNFTKRNISVVLIHHERKEGAIKGRPQSRLRGSSDILAAIDSHISVRKDGQDEHTIVAEHSKLRCEQKLQPFEIVVSGSTNEVAFEYMGEQPKMKGKIELGKEGILAVLQDSDEALPMKDVVEKVQLIIPIGSKTVRMALKELIEAGEVTKQNGLKNENLCSLATK